MSKYTTQIRWICSSFSNNEYSTGLNYEEIIENARPKIFNFYYPIFDEAYRSVLETKIIKHYFFREIGQETFAMFNIMLNTKLNEIMPYYNELYKSELLEFNPLYTDDIKTTFDRDKNDITTNINKDKTETTGKIISESENVTAANKDEKDRYSDTPQGALSNVDSLNYLSEYRHINDTEDSTVNTNASVDNNETVTKDTNGSQNIDTTEKYTQLVQGYRGYSANKLLKEFRDNLLNIDLMIIDELEELFFYLID